MIKTCSIFRYISKTPRLETTNSKVDNQILTENEPTKLGKKTKRKFRSGFNNLTGWKKKMEIVFVLYAPKLFLITLPI